MKIKPNGTPDFLRQATPSVIRAKARGWARRRLCDSGRPSTLTAMILAPWRSIAALASFTSIALVVTETIMPSLRMCCNSLGNPS